MRLDPTRKKDGLKRLFGMALSVPAIGLINAQAVVANQPSTDTGEFVPIDTVLRLLDSDFLDAQQLFLDFVPNTLPIQTPLPNQGKVLATVVYRATANDANLYRVLMEVPQPAEVAIAHYQDQLQRQGWKPPAFTAAGSSGFIPTFNFQDHQRTFCKADESYSLLVSVAPLTNSLTSFELMAFPNADNPGCTGATIGADILETVPMPALGPPDDARVSLTGSSSSASSDYATVTVNATVESELGAAAIAQHYATQWELAGWRLVKQTDSESIVTSVWSFAEDSGRLWQGTLTIEPIANESNTYNAIATVELADRSEGSE